MSFSATGAAGASRRRRAEDGVARGERVRIAFDVSPLSHERTGVNNYIRGSLAGLAAAAQRSGDEVVAFAPTSPEGRRVIPEALDGHSRRAAAVTLPGAHGWRTAWSRLGWPPAERWLGAFDVLHFTDWMYPPQRAGLRATTIHDLVPLHFPEWVTGRTRAMHTRKYENAARTCGVIFANSAFTADDVSATLGFPRERIVVAHPGIGDEYTPDGEAADLGVPYLLTVATLEPRKNLGTLVEAFGLLGRDDLSLAVAGGAGWGPQPELDRPGVVRLGRVSDEELARLYRGAAAVVYPSRFEGFGMPITEAMASGAPVVASSHPSLDEACGDAAVRADPESAEAFAAAIADALGRARRAAREGARARRAVLLGQDGRALPRGVPAILVGLDTTRAPPDPRRHGAPRARAARPPRRHRPRALVPRHVARAHARGRRALVPAAARGRRRRAALPDLPRAVPLEDAARRHRPRPGRAAAARVVQPLDAHATRGSPCRASCARPRA